MQEELFDRILAQYERRSQAVEALQALMGIGRDAVYRRFRGETPLSPDELSLLAKSYNLSLDELAFQESNKFTFVYNSFTKPIASFKDFLKEVHQGMQEIQMLPNSRLFYTTAEIPVFHYLQFPELISFKLYVWARTIWNLGDMSERSFTFDLVDQESLQIAGQILYMYNEVPSTELWHLNIVDNTLNQIEYHLKIGGFAQPEDALVLCNGLIQLVDHMQLMAEHGSKFKVGDAPPNRPNPNFDLYHNEMVSTNNTFLAVTALRRIVYTTYNTPNFLRCTDPKLCDHTEEWFNKIILKSISISTHAEKSRVWYFRRLKRKVEAAKRRVELVLMGEEI